MYVLLVGSDEKSTFIASEMAEAANALVVVEVDDTNVPGALLNEPLESHNTAALRMWLTCHGVKAASSLKKGELIER